MKRLSLALMFALGLSVVGLACNIPVFRYALERWQSDRLELLVFHEGPLNERQREILSQIRSQSQGETGNANLEILPLDLQSEISDADRRLWSQMLFDAESQPMEERGEAKGQSPAAKAGLTLPYAVLRGRHLRGPFLAWRGPLFNASRELLDSPARKRLAERILNGHAIVWLVIGGEDPQENRKVIQFLTDQNRQLSSSLELPEGIGLPGSELFSEVPLFLEFSVLKVDRRDPQEGFLLGLAEAFQPQAFQDGKPLVLPVFGRGRALEVIPAEQLSGPLVRDLTEFLSAACSCQVKEQNPGFDLLMNIPWRLELFGDGGPVPPASTADGLGQQQTPVLLSIPPGRK